MKQFQRGYETEEQLIRQSMKEFDDQMKMKTREAQIETQLMNMGSELQQEHVSQRSIPE